MHGASIVTERFQEHFKNLQTRPRIQWHPEIAPHFMASPTAVTLFLHAGSWSLSVGRDGGLGGPEPLLPPLDLLLRKRQRWGGGGK